MTLKPFKLLVLYFFVLLLQGILAQSSMGYYLSFNGEFYSGRSSNGCQLLKQEVDFKNDGTIDNVWTHTYDVHGKIIKTEGSFLYDKKNMNVNFTKYNYDTNGILVKAKTITKTINKSNVDDDRMESESVTTYNYDVHGKLAKISSTIKLNSGKMSIESVNISHYHYDVKGRLARTKMVSHSKNPHMGAYGNMKSESETHYSDYDAYGNARKITIIDTSGTRVFIYNYIYDSRGNVSKIEHQDDDGSITHYTWQCTSTGKTYSKEYAWGKRPEEFGLQEGEEIETFGPHTFSLDAQGNMYVIDSINGNIKMLNEKGEYQRHIDFTGWGSDIISGRNKEFFTLDNESLVVHPSSGKRTQHKLSTDIPQVEGYGQGMRLDDRGNLYLCQFQQCYQIGLAKKGKMDKIFSPEEQMENVMPGFPIKENRLIRTLWKNNHEAVIEIMDEDWAIVQTIPMKTDDIFGLVGFLRQDDKGFLYIEVERITDDNSVHLEVWKYDKTGKRVAVKKLPNDYYSTVYKKIVIDSTGTIYQVLTTSKGVKIVKW